MKLKPRFVLYSNINKSLKKPKLLEKYGSNLKSLFKRIPDNIIKEQPEVEKLFHLNKKITYDKICADKKPQIMNCCKTLDENQKKLALGINDFREMFYDYIKNERKEMKNYKATKNENDAFAKRFVKMESAKNKYRTGLYLDYENLIPIANRYGERKIKVPKISREHSMFSANPLILDGSELVHYFLYRLGDKNNAEKYLNKIETYVNRKQSGERFKDEEIRAFERLQKMEKPKGYIPYNILATQLKNEIEKTQFSIDHLDNFDKFFEESIKKDKRFSAITSHKKIKKSFSSGNHIISTGNVSTGVYNSRIISAITNNNGRDNNKTNTSSVLSGKNSALFRKITGPSLLSNYKKKNFLSLQKKPDKKINGNRIIEKDYFILSKPFGRANSAVHNILMRNNSLDNIKNKNKIINLNNNRKVYSLQKSNSFPIYKERLKSSIHYPNKKTFPILKEDNSKSFKECPVEELFDVKTNNNEYLNTNRKESIISNNEVIDKIKEDKINEKNEIIERKETNEKNKKIEKCQKIEIKEKNESISEKTSEKEEKSNTPEPQRLRESKLNYLRVERLFNSALDNGYRKKENKIAIEDYFKLKGWNINNKFSKKELFNNVNKMRHKAIERNFILEEYRIRNGDHAKGPLTSQQQLIIDRNKIFESLINQNEYKLKKLLCEKTYDKSNFDIID